MVTLAGAAQAESCVIHERWLGLLQSYVADEMSTRDYTERSLALLAQHKESLKASPVLVRERA